MTTTVGLVLEQTLGHVTHDRNLRDYLSGNQDVRGIYMPIAPSAPDGYERFPIIKNNLTLKASLRAKAAVARAMRDSPLDVIFYHTQVTALFSSQFARKVPVVISLDATPANFDCIGGAYGHIRGSGPAESAKAWLTRRMFRTAAHVVSWSRWAATSLADDYAVPAEKITVIPPGVDCRNWRPNPIGRDSNGALRLLFVGGDFVRKGGPTLLALFRDGGKAVPNCSLDIVTHESVPAADGLPNVRVHTSLGANSPELMALYQKADVFVLPTLADTLGIVFMEAMAAGLPVIGTRMAGIPEVVEDGKTGILLAPGDNAALRAAIDALRQPEVRARFGAAGRKVALEKFNAATNYGRLVNVLKSVASGRPDQRSPDRMPQPLGLLENAGTKAA